MAREHDLDITPPARGCPPGEFPERWPCFNHQREGTFYVVPCYALQHDSHQAALARAAVDGAQPSATECGAPCPTPQPRRRRRRALDTQRLVCGELECE